MKMMYLLGVSLLGLVRSLGKLTLSLLLLGSVTDDIL